MSNVRPSAPVNSASMPGDSAPGACSPGKPSSAVKSVGSDPSPKSKPSSDTLECNSPKSPGLTTVNVPNVAKPSQSPLGVVLCTNRERPPENNPPSRPAARMPPSVTQKPIRSSKKTMANAGSHHNLLEKYRQASRLAEETPTWNGDEDLYGVSNDECTKSTATPSDLADSTETLMEGKGRERQARTETLGGSVWQTEDAAESGNQKLSKLAYDVRIGNAEGPSDGEDCYPNSSEEEDYGPMPELEGPSIPLERPADKKGPEDPAPQVIPATVKQSKTFIGGKRRKNLIGPRAMSTGPFESAYYASNPIKRPQRWGQFGTRYSPPIASPGVMAAPTTPMCGDCGKPLDSMCEHELARSGWVDAEEEMIKNGDAPGCESSHEVDVELCQFEGGWDLI